MRPLALNHDVTGARLVEWLILHKDGFHAIGGALLIGCLEPFIIPKGRQYATVNKAPNALKKVLNIKYIK